MQRLARAGCYALRVSEGTLTKAALVEEVADAAGLTKRRAEIIVETLFGSIAEALRHGAKVELRGFGSFRLRRRAPHRGRNPRTGDRVDVPSRRVAYFTPGKELINRDPALPLPPSLSEQPASSDAPPSGAGVGRTVSANEPG